MNYLQGPVVCPSVHPKQGGVHGVPVVNGSLRKAKTLTSGMWGFRGVYNHPVRNHFQPKSITITCTFSSSSNGNGSMAESFNENDSDYVDSTVVEAGKTILVILNSLLRFQVNVSHLMLLYYCFSQIYP